jgi:hypothetical protein
VSQLTRDLVGVLARGDALSCIGVAEAVEREVQGELRPFEHALHVAQHVPLAWPSWREGFIIGTEERELRQ